MRPLIVFDMDGTLFDTMSVDGEAFNMALAQFGLPPRTPEQLRRTNGLTIEQICEVIGLGAHRGAEFDSALTRYEGELIGEHGRLYPGVPEMLSALFPRASLAIATSGSRPYLDLVAGHYRFSQYMAMMEADDGTGRHDKTHSVKKIAAAIPHSRLAMVGDRKTDIEAGLSAGGFTVAALYGFGGEEELSIAHALAPDVPSLLKILLKFVEETPQGKE